MPLMECINCGNVQTSHPKFAFCDDCGSSEFRNATQRLSG